MRILLISPITSRFIGRSYHLPIALAYISSFLKKAGAQVKFIDFEVDPLAEEKLEAVLKQWSPDFVGFSIHSLCVKSAFSLAEYIRNNKKNTSLVAGGIHPSVFPALFLENNLFDYVIRGDGEIPFTKLVSGVSLDEITGLCYRDEKTGRLIDKGVNYDPIKLEELPFPDYETIPVPAYKPPFASFFKLPSYPMLATRGCNGLCTFCTSYVYNKHHRVRAAEDVIAEIEKAIVDYHIKEVRFIDAAFTYNIKNTYELCEQLIKRNFPVTWHCSTRIDSLDNDLLALMKRAGCVGIGFGLESADQRLLEKIKKPYSLEKAVSTIQYASRIGLFIKHSFIYGLPGETEESLARTLNLSLKIPGDLAAFNRMDIHSMLSIDSGTPLEEEYRDLEKKGKERELELLLSRVSARRLQTWRYRSYFRFYLRPSLLLRNLSRKTSLFFVLYNLINIFPSFIGKALFRIRNIFPKTTGGIIKRGL